MHADHKIFANNGRKKNKRVVMLEAHWEGETMARPINITKTWKQKQREREREREKCKTRRKIGKSKQAEKKNDASWIYIWFNASSLRSYHPQNTDY